MNEWHNCDLELYFFRWGTWEVAVVMIRGTAAVALLSSIKFLSGSSQITFHLPTGIYVVRRGSSRGLIVIVTSKCIFLWFFLLPVNARTT